MKFFFFRGGVCDLQQLIRFWRWSGSRGGSGNY